MAAKANPWLEHLQPLQLPEPVSSWPLAPGWWLLLGAVGLGLLWQGLRHWRRWLDNGYRRAALQQFDELERQLCQPRQASTRLAALRELPQLLRRVALASTGYPADPTVIRLHGTQWWAWLDQPMVDQPFQHQLGPLLDQLAWAPDAQLLQLSDAEITALVQGLRQWTLRHITKAPLPDEEPPCCN